MSRKEPHGAVQTMNQDPPPPPVALSVVFRLCWKSRASRTASAPLLRDHFLKHELPPPDIPYVLPFAPHAFSVIVVRCTPGDARHASPETTAYLLPPIPPSLGPSQVPHIDTIPPLHTLLHRSLTETTHKAQSFLLLSAAGTGKSTAAADAVYRAEAVLIRLQPTHVTVGDEHALMQNLMYYADAAAAAAPAVLVLDDAHFTFPPFLQREAATFRALRCRIASLTGVALLTLATNHTDLHPVVASSADLLISLSPSVPPSVHPFDNVQDFERAWEAVHSSFPGEKEAENYLRRLLYHPLVYSRGLAELKVRTPNAILLYGSPGTGKTSLVKAAATAAKNRLFPLQSTMLARGAVGESEHLLREYIKLAAADTPALIFLDEIDALFAPALRRLQTVLGEILDRLPSGVKVVAATNAPWMVPKSLLRPGRFDKCVLVPIPSASERRKIATVYAKRIMLDTDATVTACDCAERSYGYTGADIQGACRIAVMMALNRGREIQPEDIKRGFEASKRSIDEITASKISNWRAPRAKIYRLRQQDSAA